MRRFRIAASCAIFLLLTTDVQCAEREQESATEIEIGAAGEWDLPNDFGFGPSLGVEHTMIKEWLEVEAEVSPAFINGSVELDTELTFKKPFNLSSNVEMMVGLGPEWLHKVGHGATTDSIGGVILADFQIWPSPERTYGWFIEPNYSCDFGRGREQSLGATVGLVIPIH
jgi:hypothetical protein